MHNNMKRGMWWLLLACASLSAAGAAVAQSGTAYPARPIRLIVPFVPGGSVDFVARIIQPRFSELLGQQVVIDNRPGASGNIAVELTANSPPDGHTVLLGNVGASAINPSVFPKFPVHAGRDLQAVTLLVDVPGALGVHAAVPVATLKEFIEYAKARPGQLNYGSSAASSAQSLAMEYFMAKAGIKLVSIPYKGGAGAATLAVLAGEVSANMLTTASFVPHLKGGKVKVLAVISPKRVSQLPEVPTMIEHGYPELRLGSWIGIFVARQTPPAIVKRIYDTTLKVAADPLVVERLNGGGAVVVTSNSPAEFADFMRVQTEFWAKIVKQTGSAAE
jgi:tripartite-type tricarboxylate transporter receptor subunit TctC